MKEGEHRQQPDLPQPSRESGQPPGVFRAWWRESRLRKLISRQNPVNTPTPHNPDESSREQVPGEEVHQVFDKWNERELRKMHRPVSLYANTYQRQVVQMVRYLVETAWRRETDDDIAFVERLDEEVERKNELRLQRIAGLTPEQQEQIEIEDSMRELRARRTMSGRINFAQSKLDAEQLAKLQQHDPEFIDPIIRGVEMRPARLEKALIALERVYQPPQRTNCAPKSR